VVTLHDVIYLACPQDLPSQIGRMYYRVMMASAVKRSDRIITDSDFSKKDIVRYLGAKPEKIEVVRPGIDPIFRQVTDGEKLGAIRARWGIQGDYLIYAGIYKPRKNHVGLLRAFKHFLGRGVDVKLVIAGPMNEGETGLRELAAEMDIAERVVFTGFVSDADLPAIYSGARVYACPSLYEGFGFTVLEAMACGVPVVCSPETSLPEVAGDAAIYADPRNPAEFGDALYRVFSDKQIAQALREKGKKNVQRFSWSKAAGQVLSVYERVRSGAVVVKESAA